MLSSGVVEDKAVEQKGLEAFNTNNYEPIICNTKEKGCNKRKIVEISIQKSSRTTDHFFNDNLEDGEITDKVHNLIPKKDSNKKILSKKKNGHNSHPFSLSHDNTIPVHFNQDKELIKSLNPCLINPHFLWPEGTSIKQ